MENVSASSGIYLAGWRSSNIRKVPGSNLDRNTDYFDRNFSFTRIKILSALCSQALLTCYYLLECGANLTKYKLIVCDIIFLIFR
jgi:hypothetical protein